MHPNIVGFDEVFEANNTAYYVMEYIEGESLKDYVASRGSLTEEETMSIMQPILEAVQLLHSHRICHLDIKPANIMLTMPDEGGMRPVLIDFGLSKHYDKEGHATSTINTFGYSDGYSPAEQYGGITKFSPTADIYSLGATLYYCLTGQKPQSALELSNGELATQLPDTVSARLRKNIELMTNNLRTRPTSLDQILGTSTQHQQYNIEEDTPTLTLPDTKATDADTHSTATKIIEDDISGSASSNAPISPVHGHSILDKSSQPTNLKQPKKSLMHNKWVFIAILVVLAGVLCISLFFVFANNSRKVMAFTAGGLIILNFAVGILVTSIKGKYFVKVNEKIFLSVSIGVITFVILQMAITYFVEFENAPLTVFLLPIAAIICVLICKRLKYPKPIKHTKLLKSLFVTLSITSIVPIFSIIFESDASIMGLKGNVKEVQDYYFYFSDGNPHINSKTIYTFDIKGNLIEFIDSCRLFNNSVDIISYKNSAPVRGYRYYESSYNKHEREMSDSELYTVISRYRKFESDDGFIKDNHGNWIGKMPSSKDEKAFTLPTHARKIYYYP